MVEHGYKVWRIGNLCGWEQEEALFWGKRGREWSSEVGFLTLVSPPRHHSFHW